MNPIRISVFGGVTCGQHGLMGDFRKILLERGVNAEMSCQEEKCGARWQMHTTLSGASVQFDWYCGAIFYPEEAVAKFLDQGDVALCIFNWAFASRNQDYYPISRIREPKPKENPRVWVFVIINADEFPVSEMQLPIAESEFHHISRPTGAGVKELLAVIEGKVREVVLQTD